MYEGKALINEYLGSDENIVIPDVIDGYEVTGLALFKWEPKDNISVVKSVVIPDTVTKIWFRCFQNFTNLETVTFGSHVESIGMCAFLGCSSLKEVELPDSVTDLQGGAFAQCSSLKKVKLPKNLTSIENGTFWNCASLCDVVLPEKLKVISGPTDGGATDEALIHGAFDSCSFLCEIILPEGLEEIGAYAFYYSGLNSVSIPGSVKRILDYAFVSSHYAGEYFLNIFIPPTVEIVSDYAFGYSYDSYNREYIKIGYNGFSIYRFTVFGCQGTASEVYETENGFDFVTIEESTVNDLRDCGVTYGCVWTLTKDGKMVIAPKNEYGGIMGVYAYYCPWWKYFYDIKEVVFEEGVESTGTHTFYGFPILTKITMADSINKCDSSAFSRTGYYYDELNWEGDILYLGDWAICFRQNQSGIYTIKEGINQITSEALRYDKSYDEFPPLENIQEIHFPKSFTVISYLDCCSLKSVYLSDSVSVIEDKALGYYYNGKIEGFTIYGYTGTVAETYASENGFTFIPMKPAEPVYVEKTDEKTGVAATVDEAVELKVDDVTDEASENITVSDGEEIFRVYTIALEKDGETVQPSEQVTVKIPCNNENAKVYRVEDDNSLTDLNAEYKNGYLIFETDHFSFYIVTVPETIKIGDVNGDGKVTIDDATLLQKAIAELIELDDTQKNAADTNSDGKITIDDATMIQKYIAELIDHLG